MCDKYAYVDSADTGRRAALGVKAGGGGAPVGAMLAMSSTDNAQCVPDASYNGRPPPPRYAEVNLPCPVEVLFAKPIDGHATRVEFDHVPTRQRVADMGNCVPLLPGYASCFHEDHFHQVLGDTEAYTRFLALLDPANVIAHTPEHDAAVQQRDTKILDTLVEMAQSGKYSDKPNLPAFFRRHFQATSRPLPGHPSRARVVTFFHYPSRSNTSDAVTHQRHATQVAIRAGLRSERESGLPSAFYNYFPEQVLSPDQFAAEAATGADMGEEILFAELGKGHKALDDFHTSELLGRVKTPGLFQMVVAYGDEPRRVVKKTADLAELDDDLVVVKFKISLREAEPFEMGLFCPATLVLKHAHAHATLARESCTVRCLNPAQAGRAPLPAAFVDETSKHISSTRDNIIRRFRDYAHLGQHDPFHQKVMPEGYGIVTANFFLVYNPAQQGCIMMTSVPHPTTLRLSTGARTGLTNMSSAQLMDHVHALAFRVLTGAPACPPTWLCTTEEYNRREAAKVGGSDVWRARVLDTTGMTEVPPNFVPAGVKELPKSLVVYGVTPGTPRSLDHAPTYLERVEFVLNERARRNNRTPITPVAPATLTTANATAGLSTSSSSSAPSSARADKHLAANSAKSNFYKAGPTYQSVCACGFVNTADTWSTSDDRRPLIRRVEHCIWPDHPAGQTKSCLANIPLDPALRAKAVFMDNNTKIQVVPYTDRAWVIKTVDIAMVQADTSQHIGA